MNLVVNIQMMMNLIVSSFITAKGGEEFGPDWKGILHCLL